MGSSLGGGLLRLDTGANRVGFFALAAYVAALAYGLRALVRRRGADAAAIGFIWIVLAWTLAVGVLTDLGENYRSALPVQPLVVALVAVALHRLFLRRRSGSR